MICGGKNGDKKIYKPISNAFIYLFIIMVSDIENNSFP